MKMKRSDLRGKLNLAATLTLVSMGVGLFIGTVAASNMSSFRGGKAALLGLLTGGGLIGLTCAVNANNQHKNELERLQRDKDTISSLRTQNGQLLDKNRVCLESLEVLQQTLQKAEDQSKRQAKQVKEKELAIASIKGKLEETRTQVNDKIEEIKILNERLEENERFLDEVEENIASRIKSLAEEKIKELNDEYDERHQQLEEDFESKNAANKEAFKKLFTDKCKTLPDKIKIRVDKGIAKQLEEFQEDLQEIIAERDQLRKTLNRYDEELLIVEQDTKAVFDFDEQAYQKVVAQAKELQALLDQRDIIIAKLKLQIQELNKPNYFPSGRSHLPGNILIDHALEKGVILDAIQRYPKPEQGIETYTFSLREGQSVTKSRTKLNADTAELQIKLGSLSLVQYEYDAEKLIFKVTTKLFNKKIGKDSIDRLWLKHTQFKSLVKDVCAFRVSAAKGGSKSPTVRNILGAKLLAGEKFKIVRYDPSSGSKKDYWRVAAKYNSYEEAIDLCYEIQGLIKTRQHAKQSNQGVEFTWTYFVIDELDNTILKRNDYKIPVGDEEQSESRFIMGTIANAVKEGEHLQIGIIIATQTATTRQLMKHESIDKNFFNNLCQVFVEKNVFDYLASDTDQTKTAGLSSKFRTIYDWAVEENEKIGGEKGKYRPALFISKARKEIIELPPLGEFGFDKLDPTEPYEFDEFSAYDYADSTSLDKCLMSGKIGDNQGGLIDGKPKNSADKATQNYPNGTQEKGLPHSSNVDTAILPNFSTEDKNTPDKPIQRFCTKCGSKLIDKGLTKKGKYQGKRQYFCSGKERHTKSMGPKTFYFD